MFEAFILFYLFFHVLITIVKKQGPFANKKTSFKGILQLIHYVLVIFIICIVSYKGLMAWMSNAPGNVYVQAVIIFLGALISSWFINFHLQEEGSFKRKNVSVALGLILLMFVLYLVFSRY